jgi:mRNA-degrading endonuclease RelE of RelBE toxin-antitoxin system
VSYKVILTPRFKKEAKRLAKRYRSLRADLAELNGRLVEDPETGTSLGGNLYKVRMAIASKGKGRSGGARVITYFVTEDGEVYLLTIYDKSEQESVDTKELRKVVADIEAAKRR